MPDEEKVIGMKGEVARLARKCNTQVDVIKKLLKEKEPFNNEVCKAAALFFALCKELARRNGFYKPQKDTEISRRYRIVENKLFKCCMADVCGEVDVKKYLDFWASIGFLGRDSKGYVVSNYSVDGRSQRSVRVARGLVEAAQAAVEAGEKT